MNNLQGQFDRCMSPNFVMIAGEYEGPLRINKPCIIDGSMSTVWSEFGPVIIVDSEDVVIKNLRVETTGNIESSPYVAIETKYDDTRLENVEVRGNIKGFKAEQGSWKLPCEIKLGDFASHEKNTFVVELDVASDAEVVNTIRGITIRPERLYAGKNSLIIETDLLNNNIVIYGELFIKSIVTRRINITGRALQDAPVHHDDIALKTPCLSHKQTEIPDVVIELEENELNVQKLKRGQRVSLNALKDSVIKVSYEYETKSEGIDIDGYAFMLDKAGKVSCDDNFVFFGNVDSSDHAVKSGCIDGMAVITLDLNKISAEVEKVDICYSIYGDNPNLNFSEVKRQIVHISANDEEIYCCELNNLSVEKTVVALEIYRYKGDWRLNFIGSGYRNGLKQLCESYGVVIED